MENDRHQRGEKTWKELYSEKVRQEEEKRQRRWEPVVAAPVPRLIKCRPRPEADLTPDSWAQIATRSPDQEVRAPAHLQWEIVDIELDENERVDVDVIPRSEIEKATKRLCEEVKEAQRKAQTNHFLFQDHDDDEREEKPEVTERSRPTEDQLLVREISKEEEGELLMDQEGTRATKQDKSKRRRALRWFNEKLKERYERKIELSHYNEEHKGHKAVLSGAYAGHTYSISRAEQEQRNRAKLLKNDQKRQRMEDFLVEWERKSARKKEAKLKTVEEIIHHSIFFSLVED